MLITKKKYERHAEITDEAEKHAQELSSESHAEIASGTEQQQADDATEGTSDAPEYEFFNPGTCSTHKNYDLALDMRMAPGNTTDIEISSNRLPDEEYYKILASLNHKQREFFTHVYHWMQDKRRTTFCLSQWRCCSNSSSLSSIAQILVWY